MVSTSSWIASCCMAIDCRKKHVCRTIGLGGLTALHFARSTPSGMCSQEVVDHPYIYIYIPYIPMLWGIISPYTTGGITNLLSGMHPQAICITKTQIFQIAICFQLSNVTSKKNIKEWLGFLSELLFLSPWKVSMCLQSFNLVLWADPSSDGCCWLASRR